MASDNTIVVGFETEGVQMTREALQSLRSESEKFEKAETQAYIEQGRRNAKRTAEQLADLRKLQAEHRANLDASIKYSTGFAGGLNKIADDIKRVGKDLDNVSGKGAKDFAMMTEGALSVVAAIGTGGVAGAIGLATLAVGTIVGKWQESEKAAGEAAKKAGDAAKAHADLVKEISAGIRAGQKQLDMEGVLQKEAELQARRRLLTQRGNELVEASLNIQKAIENHSASELIAARQAYNAKRLEIQKEHSEILLEEKKVSDRKNRLLQRDINEGILDMQKGALAEQKKVQVEKHEDTFEETAKLRDFANNKEAADAKLHRERMAAIMFDDEYDKDLPLPPGLGLRPEEIKAQEERDEMLRKADEMLRKAGEDAERASEKRADTLAKEAAALKKKQEAEEQANNALIAHTAATIAYESAAMFVQPAISGLTNKIGELRDVNRENFKDFFDFSKMTPELVAAQVQAIAVGIAQQALGKAAMSGADAVKETALAIGDFAYGNAAGGTAHLKSAALHASAAVAYGAIAGGSAGVAVGIGATRGATAEEKERDNRRKDRSDGTGSMSSGSTMGRGDGSGGGGFSVTVVNNAPLIVPPSDQGRAGRAVARAVSRAQRDAFARREMRG